MQCRPCISTQRIRSSARFNISLARLRIFFIRLCQACNKNHPSNKQFHLTFSLPHCVGLFSVPHLSPAQFLIKLGPIPTGRIRHTALMDVFNLKKCKCRFKLFTQQALEGRRRKALLKNGQENPSLMVSAVRNWIMHALNMWLLGHSKLYHLLRTKRVDLHLTRPVPQV